MEKSSGGALYILFMLCFALATWCMDADAAAIASACNDAENGDLKEAGDIHSGNRYPVVLLHGFIGWGRDELGGACGHYYWGGFDDLQEVLNESGHACYTAVVGPLSSNWDRACELYAQLAGTRVDYGLAHAQRHNHERFGRDYTGKALIPDFGGQGDNQKIHIIAHSQGAMTARMFAQLMEQGSPEEKNADYSGVEPVSPFFSGTSGTADKICSITTMAGVNNGATLSNGVVKLMPFIKELVIGVAAIIGVDANETILNIYDFKLEQFGVVARQKGETLNEYFDRVQVAWDNYFSTDQKDISLWDLSPEGCIEQNAWVHAQPNIYYFSYAGEATHAAAFPSRLDNYEYYQLPDTNSFIVWMFSGTMIGTYTCNDDRYRGLWRARDGDFYGMDVADRVPIDGRWWRNDGVVNTISMDGPWLYPDNYEGPRDVIVDWDGFSAPQKGLWNYGGVLTNVDHFDVTGIEIFPGDKDNHRCPLFDHIEDWYIEMADMLSTL